MIGSIFKLKHQLYTDVFKYDKRYENYFTTKIIYENKGLKIEDFIQICEDEFGKAVSHSGTKKFLEDNFKFDRKKYYASIGEASYLNSLYDVLNKFYYNQNKGLEYITNEIYETFKYHNKELIDLLSLLMAYNNLNNSKDIEYYAMLAYDIISNFDNYSKYIEDIFNDDSINKNKEISLIFKDTKIIQILNMNSFYLISDLNKMTKEEIVSLFYEDICNLRKRLKLISLDDINSYIENSVLNYFKKCCQSDKNLDIFNYRNGIACEEHSLEETGEKEGLTRERVRQICAKIEEKLLFNINDILFDLDYFFSLIDFNKLLFIEKSYLKNILNSDLAIDEISFLCNLIDMNIYYDKDYEIFFDKNLHNINEFIETAFEKIGYAINGNYLNDLSSFEKRVLYKNYRLDSHNENFYIRKGISYTEIVVKLIDENFSNGFKLGDEDEYNKLKQLFKEKYNVECKLSNRAINGDLERFNYCYIDRGKVKNRKFLNGLPDDLIIDINNYLASKGGIVYYTSIFEDFKERLVQIGVNNRYFLKGLLDDYLLESFQHKRDYIIVENGFKNPFEIIKNEINNSTGVVNVDDFRKKYNGVQDYVFMNYISQIEDVVWLKYLKEFILLKNIDISELTIELIDENIKYLFNSLNQKVIHTSKLYSLLKIKYPKIFDELYLIKDVFSLYSLVSCLFKNKYYFRRPYISCDENAELSKEAILNEFVYKQQKINADIISGYLNKMHLTQLYSYLNLLIDISDSFIQINKDTAYKKELLNVDESQLAAIKYELNYYINSFGPIDTRKYNDYVSLPKLKVGWNKYLLVGIIRTYFNDYYSIEYTDVTYDATDFIIRRYK